MRSRFVHERSYVTALTSHTNKPQARSTVAIHVSRPAASREPRTPAFIHSAARHIHSTSFSTKKATCCAATMVAAEDRVEQFEGQAPPGKGRGGKAPKGAGAALPSSAAKREKDLSRALSRLLRHQALNAGIPLDKEGYAPLEKVVSELSCSCHQTTGLRNSPCQGSDCA